MKPGEVRRALARAEGRPVPGARRYHEPQVCPECGKTVATLVPWHGDGTLALFVAHGPVRARCPGSRQAPPGYDWPGPYRDLKRGDTLPHPDV